MMVAGAFFLTVLSAALLVPPRLSRFAWLPLAAGALLFGGLVGFEMSRVTSEESGLFVVFSAVFGLGLAAMGGALVGGLALFARWGSPRRERAVLHTVATRAFLTPVILLLALVAAGAMGRFGK